MHKKMIMVLAGAAAMMSAAASAQVTYSGSATGPLPGSAYTTFDNRTLGNTTQTTNTGITVSFTGGGAFVQGSSGGLYSAPTVYGTVGTNYGQANGPDATTYITSGVGTATLSFASAQSYLGLLWGSVDSYNTLTFNFANGMSQMITGTQVLGATGGGLGSNGSLYVNFLSSTPFTSVVAKSTTNAFEFDDVALATSAVPEAATWAMMMIGLGAVGGSIRRRRSVTSTRVSFA